MPFYYVKISNRSHLYDTNPFIQCYEFVSDDDLFATIRLWGETSKRWGYSTKYEHVPESCIYNMFGSDKQWYHGMRVDIPERFKRFNVKK